MEKLDDSQKVVILNKSGNILDYKIELEDKGKRFKRWIKFSTLILKRLI